MNSNSLLESAFILLLILSVSFSCLNAQYTGNSPFCPEKGGLIINEVSNGISGNTNQEYIEFLVIGAANKPNTPVDISGWIIDDNNAPNTRQGSAMGHIILGSCYSAVNPGDLLVVYNADERNPSLPPDDPMDENDDGVYIIPHTADCLIPCNSNPFPSDRPNAGSSRSDYCPCIDPSASIPNWQLGLRNSGDVLQVRDRCASVVHAIHWGDVEMTPEVENAPTRIHFDASQEGKTIAFREGNWNDARNWVNADASNSETPGRPNDIANLRFRASLFAGLLNCGGIVDNCDKTDAGDILLPINFTNNPITICRGDDLLAFDHGYLNEDEELPNNSDFNFEYAYLLTVTNAPSFTIIDFNTTGDFDFTDATGNRYFIWGLSYARTDGGPEVLDFLTTEVRSIADIQNYTACGYFFDVDNLDQNGEVVEVLIEALPEVIPLDFQLCEESEGQISFNLNEVAEFLAYEQDSVLWYSDPALQMRINPDEIFQTGDNVIYAEAYLKACASDPVTVTIDVVVNPIIEADIRNRTCNGSNDSAISFTVSGERPPYFINWVNPDWDGQETVTDLPSGPYQVTIVDESNICSTTFDFEILEPDLVRLDCFGTTAPSSSSDIDGTFQFNVGGGVSPYTISWGENMQRRQGVAGLDTLKNLAAGRYEFIVIDALGCTQSCSFEIPRFECTERIDIDTTICINQQIEIANTLYDINNPTGSTFISGAETGTCDSLFNIQVNFFEEFNTNLNTRLCPTGSVLVNGTIYDSNNPNGIETLSSVNGCDSTIIIDLQFGALDTTVLQGLLCVEESLVVNGTRYNAANPSGIEVFALGETNCDSVVLIDLQFRPLPNLIIDTVLCMDGFLELNGRIYNQDRPTGTQVLSGASVTGCDSIININLQFAEAIIVDFAPILCIEEEIPINGTIYNFDNPTGTETLIGASQSGCDSTLNISLQFMETITQNIQETLCAEASLAINGTTYDINKPTGIELLPNASVEGCDSTVIIELDFFPPAQFELNEQLCIGDELLINGTIYNQNNPNGIEVLSGASSTGCDSTITILLEFSETVLGVFQESLCEDEQVNINGEIFDQSNPNGTILLSNASVAGCDSIVEVILEFERQDTSFIQATLCSGGELIVNGISYNENRPFGLERVSSATACDSLIQIDLDFTQAISTTTTTNSPTCVGDEDGIIRIENVVGGTEPYTISLDESITNSTNFPLRFNKLNAGSYTLQIEDADGCISRQSIVVEAPKELLVDLGETLQISSGDSIQINSIVSENVKDWEWSSSVFLDDPTSLFPFAAPTRSIIYTLTVFDEQGCSASDQLQIIVSTKRNVFIPTAFSPNADGVNDFFTIYADKRVVNIKAFQVFDRWGNLLFQRSNLLPNQASLGWNGRNLKQQTQAGIYVYHAVIEFSDGKIEAFSGEIVLIL